MSTEERMQILKMVSEGKVTADEGARLLEALGSQRRRSEEQSERGTRGGDRRWLRIRVTDLKSGRNKVNLNLPIGLVGIGAKLGARFAAPMDLDVEEILEAVRSGTEGKIIDVEDSEDGERVEIFVE
ncbi:MAG: hypothetical protein HY326_02570 [Chloroflexi bacterium]|nr:hypothetical protein [Chloroflexota bacterium]